MPQLLLYCIDTYRIAHMAATGQALQYKMPVLNIRQNST